MKQLTKHNRIRREIQQKRADIDRHFDEYSTDYNESKCWTDFWDMQNLSSQLPKGDFANAHLEHATSIIIEIKSNGG